MPYQRDEVDSVPVGSVPVNFNSDDEASLGIDLNPDEAINEDALTGQGEDGVAAETQEELSKTAEQVAGKSTEELVKMLEDAQQQIGKMGEELGSLRTAVTGKGKEQEAAPATPDRDFDAELDVLRTKVEDGELTASEAYIEQTKILREQMSYVMDTKLAEKEREHQAKTAVQKFLEQNQDFEQVTQTQEAESFLRQNPVYDRLAYYERTQRAKAETMLTQTMAQLASVTAELEAARKAGAVGTDKVGKDAGAGVREARTAPQPPPKSFNPKKARESGLAALRALQG
jgi:hypothetical protein